MSMFGRPQFLCLSDYIFLEIKRLSWIYSELLEFGEVEKAWKFYIGDIVLYADFEHRRKYIDTFSLWLQILTPQSLLKKTLQDLSVSFGNWTGDNFCHDSSPRQSVLYIGESVKIYRPQSIESVTGYENPSIIPQKPPKPRRKLSGTKSLKSLKITTKSLPSTPVKKIPNDPLAPRSHQMIDYEEISERINDLERQNEQLLDDNRTLSEGFLTKEKGLEALMTRMTDVNNENRKLRKKIKTSKDEETEKQESEIKKKLQKNFEKEKECFRKRLKQLDDEQLKDRIKIKQLNDRCEKSKLEVIGLNKGISRKNEENNQLRTDVSDLESRIEEFQTNWASQEAELVRLRNQIGDLEKMRVKEACMISIVKQLIETDLIERQKQATNHKQLYQMAKILDINTGPEPTDKEDLEAEINRLNSIIEKQNSDLTNESEKYQCNICQEKFDSSERRKCCLSSCGHIFCHNCAHSFLKTQPSSKSNKSQNQVPNCPSCRKPFNKSQIIVIYE